jgi:GntR family transcriptional regulator/MocR family aminotransferase
VVPTGLAPAVERLQARGGLGAALQEQLALARFMASGELDRHLRRTRRRYRARRDALVAAVAAELPDWRIEGIAAGLQAVVRLPEGSDEAAVVRAAAARGVGVEGLGRFRVGPASSAPGLVLGYANLPEPAIVRAVADLAAAVVGPARTGGTGRA